MIELGDGSMGMLPEEWLKKYGMLVDLGNRREDGHLRFSHVAGRHARRAPGRAAGDPGRRRLREGPAEPAPVRGGRGARLAAGFHGELRPYQCEGLGWLDYLQQFGFGGILADDMGLGKTIQVLAFLQRRRAQRQAKGPSLAVVPRSLVFNWVQEAAKFTPAAPRARLHRARTATPSARQFRDYDLIITTYGTVRTDIAELTQHRVRLRDPRRGPGDQERREPVGQGRPAAAQPARLAISGTPIENHLGELWSIFEFLNPGMLGSDPVFKQYAGGGASLERARPRACWPRPCGRSSSAAPSSRSSRTCPEKTEQTLHCDMEADQRALYDELRAHYRDALLRKDTAELNRSKIEVLEALLRLRQAACHPGLISPELATEPSAKLDMLMPSIAEVVEEGHKVLVFSQFTSFLAIVRDRLDQERITYEYLDGRTRNRAARVERFQTDPDCPIFLISLKAGGLGPEPDRRRIRLPARPVVEPGRRGPGHRPLAPDRPDPARLRLPPDLPRHRRGEDPRTPAEEARPRRRHPQRRQPRCHPEPLARGHRVPAVMSRGFTRVR